MAKKFDLGDALADVLKVSESDTETLEQIDINLIDGDDRNFYAIDGIDDLAANIQLIGLQQPIRIRPNPDMPGRYRIVSGHRRRAALWTLYEEAPERWGKVPCIIEHDAVSPAMEELRLIYANADTRRMSSADISKQAERVEMLLYELKEEGVEFPGRMRDHVAAACKVSTTKLATLKVIRENLIDELKPYWEKGDLKESVAYAFAKLPPETQRLTAKMVRERLPWMREPKEWHEANVTRWATDVTNELKPKKGPRGTCESCDHQEARLLRMSGGLRYDDHCNNGKCCHDCPNLGTCEYACPHLSGEIAKAKEIAKARKDADKEAQRKADAKQVAPTVRLWKRFGEARAAAGLTFEEYAKKADVSAFRREKKVADFEQGKKITPSSGGLPYAGGDGVDEWRIRSLIKAADALGCSVDYLLCRTDEPRKIQDLKRVAREWRSRGETPPVGKPIITYGLTNDGPKYTPAVWNGSRFYAPGKPEKTLTGLEQQFTKWTLLPED